MTLRYHTPLSPAEQLAAGLPEPQVLAMADKVRYGELDTNNHVNNAAYFSWLETLRVDYLDRFVLPHFDTAPRTVLRGGEVRFVKEILEGEDYIVTVQATAFRNTSLTVRQMIWSGDLRATFDGVMVMLTPDGSGRMPLPDAVRTLLTERDGALAEG